jgi:hypothetical protein
MRAMYMNSRWHEIGECGVPFWLVTQTRISVHLLCQESYFQTIKEEQKKRGAFAPVRAGKTGLESFVHSSQSRDACVDAYIHWS